METTNQFIGIQDMLVILATKMYKAGMSEKEVFNKLKKLHAKGPEKIKEEFELWFA